MNAQTWLKAVLDRLRPYFHSRGCPLPEHIAVSIGWCHKSPNTTMGFICEPSKGVPCWEVYLSPMVTDGREAVCILIHELTHIAVGPEHGHRGPFKHTMEAFGFRGALRYTCWRRGLHDAFLTFLMAGLGPYPWRRKRI